MKLLLDHNLSPKLLVIFKDHFPGSEHVFHLGLDTANDPAIWEYARERGLILVVSFP